MINNRVNINEFEDENIFRNHINIISTQISDSLKSYENVTNDKMTWKLKKFNPNYTIVSQEFINNLYKEDKDLVKRAVSFFRKKIK